MKRPHAELIKQWSEDDNLKVYKYVPEHTLWVIDETPKWLKGTQYRVGTVPKSGLSDEGLLAQYHRYRSNGLPTALREIADLAVHLDRRKIIQYFEQHMADSPMKDSVISNILML